MEFILMLRKSGGYRQPSEEQRNWSRLSKDEHHDWFQQIWTIPGESTRAHPAPYPEELAYRLVRMFSFTGDTVLDPFMGSGTTILAAAKCGRNGIGVEIDPSYFAKAKGRLRATPQSLFAMPPMTAARTWRTRWAPSGDHRICRRLFIRALTRLLTTDSAPELAIRNPALYRRP